MQRTIEIRTDDLSGEATPSLIAFHLAETRDTSPPESMHALDLEALRHPSVSVWSAWIDGELAGSVRSRRSTPPAARSSRCA